MVVREKPIIMVNTFIREFTHWAVIVIMIIIVMIMIMIITRQSQSCTDCSDQDN